MRRARTLLAGILLAAPCAFALNPALEISQYAHKSWKNRDGFAKGVINSIAQTPDGYLWLGTDYGLTRFDGVQNVEWTPPPGEHLTTSYIRNLLVTRDGALWIGTGNELVSWKGGKLTHYPELSGQYVSALLEDREGTLWAGLSPKGRLCAIHKNKVSCYGEDGRFGSGIYSLREYGGGLWVGASTGLWRWKPGPPKLYSEPRPLADIGDLIEGDNHALWMAMRDGVGQLVGDRIQVPPPAVGGSLKVYRMLRDREGGLWIATAGQGLRHVHQGRTDVFALADGLTGDRVSSLFEDGEGNIWAATNDGLDCFRDVAVPTISSRQGLSDIVDATLAARDGSVWFGSNGLYRWTDGRLTIYRKRRSRGRLAGFAPQETVREVNDDQLPDDIPESLFQDDRGRIWISTSRGVAWFEDGRFTSVAKVPTTMVHSMSEGSAGDLWINDQKLGLFHWLDGRLLEQFSWARLGVTDLATDLAIDEQGGLWIGFFRGGISYFKDGHIRRSYGVADGLGEGRVNDLRLDRGSTLWAATEGGLSRFKDGRIATLISNNGLPCDAVHWSIEDDAGSTWLGMPCGLMRIPRSEMDAWAADSHHKVKATLFDRFEGFRSLAPATGYSPRVSKGRDGKLWFGGPNGLSFMDPRHIPINKLPPPVHIEKITANGTPHDLASNRDGRLSLPPLVRDLEIDYTALSFVVPEKVRFKYRLEGHDPDWVDAGTRRQAFYNDLRPRQYRFRVIACNNTGVWNEAGASFDFSIAPKFYQTNWFYASCVAAFLALLWGAHRLRVAYLTQQFNARLEGRVSERTRVARDLHDTLLQSFQGTLLKFHALSYQLPDHPEARKTLENCIEQARAAIAEGRDAVQGLRSSTTVTNDLARDIAAFGKALVADQRGENCPRFSVQVEGKSRDLPPLVRNEIYHIACESVRNSFRHAQAKRIEVECRYDARRFRLRVVDDGKGIDPAVISAGGRAGHHGLPGIRERAELAGGKLAVWSQINSGTEIELTIPDSIAYARPAPGRWPMSSGQGGA
jgi:signal transduction histidine kinase/ligand-binding sensor domain-containing protein